MFIKKLPFNSPTDKTGIKFRKRDINGNKNPVLKNWTYHHHVTKQTWPREYRNHLHLHLHLRRGRARLLENASRSVSFYGVLGLRLLSSVQVCWGLSILFVLSFGVGGECGWSLLGSVSFRCCSWCWCWIGVVLVPVLVDLILDSWYAYWSLWECGFRLGFVSFF